MKTWIHVCAALACALVSGQASAIATLKKATPTFYQLNNSTLMAGLTVEASTSLPILIIAGGFTITCSTSALAQPVQQRRTYSGFMGVSQTLYVPEVVPSAYTIPNWSSIPAGTCSGQCLMQWTAEAEDQTTLSIRIGNTGAGAQFTLIPQGIQSIGNVRLANICRSGRPQCCTPMCVIP
jgi:hypothetical protein